MEMMEENFEGTFDIKGMVMSGPEDSLFIWEKQMRQER